MKLFYFPLFLSSPDVEIKYIGGADPEMVLLSEDSTEVKVCECVYSRIGYDCFSCSEFQCLNFQKKRLWSCLVLMEL